MELAVSGEITQEEVEKLVRAHVEQTTGRKLKSIQSKTRIKPDPEDWQTRNPPDYVSDGFRFELAETKTPEAVDEVLSNRDQGRKFGAYPVG